MPITYSWTSGAHASIAPSSGPVIPVLTAAFQADAFQNDAFQVEDLVTAVADGDTTLSNFQSQGCLHRGNAMARVPAPARGVDTRVWFNSVYTHRPNCACGCRRE